MLGRRRRFGASISSIPAQRLVFAGILLAELTLNSLSAGDAFKRIQTVFPQLKFDRN